MSEHYSIIAQQLDKLWELQIKYQSGQMNREHFEKEKSSLVEDIVRIAEEKK